MNMDKDNWMYCLIALVAGACTGNRRRKQLMKAVSWYQKGERHG